LIIGAIEQRYSARLDPTPVSRKSAAVQLTIWRDRGVAVHEIAGAESRITTVFVYRHDALISSALKEFLKFARPTPVRMQAAE
jgi:hypothetical protein